MLLRVLAALALVGGARAQCTVTGLSAPADGALDAACADGATLTDGASCALSCGAGFDLSGGQPSCSGTSFVAGTVACAAIACDSAAAPVGYEQPTETDLIVASFDVTAACAPNWQGTAVVTACGATGGAYTVSGCTPVVLCPDGGTSGHYEPCTEALALIDATGHAVVPDTYAAVGSFAFFRMASLVRNDAGQMVAGLRTVMLPSTLVSIGAYAFRGTALSSIDIPATVSAVGAHAFYDCGDLVAVTLSSGLTAAGLAESAYMGTSITDWSFIVSRQAHVLCPESKYTKTACADAIALIDGQGEATVPSTYSVIGTSLYNRIFPPFSLGIWLILALFWTGEHAFFERADLLSLVLPVGLTEIGDFAFRGSGISTIVDIPTTCTSIGRQAFFDCGGSGTYYSDLRMQSVAMQLLP